MQQILDSNDPTLLSTAFEAGAMIVNALRSPLFERCVVVLTYRSCNNSTDNIVIFYLCDGSSPLNGAGMNHLSASRCVSSCSASATVDGV